MHRLIKLANIDWQLVTLNIASGGALVVDSITNKTPVWAVGFLIVTIGILNLAKAYSTYKEAKKKEKK